MKSNVIVMFVSVTEQLLIQFIYIFTFLSGRFSNLVIFLQIRLDGVLSFLFLSNSSVFKLYLLKSLNLHAFFCKSKKSQITWRTIDFSSLSDVVRSQYFIE